MLASSTPATTRLCASCATVEANAPRRRPKPCTSPTPTRPVAWWRSTTASFARSRAGSATTRPPATAGSAAPAPVISCSACSSITRTRPAAGPRSSASSPSGASRMLSRTHAGTAGASNGSAAPSRAATVPPAITRRRAERLEVLQHDEVGAEARRDRAEVRQPVAAGADAASPSAARPRARSRRRRPRGTSRRCGPRGRACRARGRPCRTRSARARSGGRARAGRAGCARWTPRAAAPTARGGASPAPPPRSSPRGRSGSRRPRRRRAPRPVTPGAWPSTCGCRATLASTSGSPAMTDGKSITSATPSARPRRRIDAMSSVPSGPRGDSSALAGTHDGAIT